MVGKLALSRMGRRYNWWPDLPDQRDYLFASYVKKVPGLPKRVNLRKDCSPVMDQGKIGSCTGHALAGAYEFLQGRDLKDKDLDDPQVFEQGKFHSVSRLFIYYNERVLMGTVTIDSGATLRDGVKSLVKWGACREKLWKYSSSNLFRKPAPDAYDEGESHKISLYLRLETLNDMKQCLAAGFPLVFGMAVYESFESDSVRKTGVVPMPTMSERLLGGHAVMAVGYDDDKKRLLVRNSWGHEWGNNGYFVMPYEYVSNARLARDFWTIRR